MFISRRRFIQLAAGSAAGMAYLRKVRGDSLSYQEVIDQWSDEIEEWTPSVCEECQGGCGVLARSVDGKVVKIEGNPFHPINKGRLCMRGHAGLQHLYHPERIKGPLKRMGERGEGKWEPISWNEAVQTVADTLKKLRADGKSHTVAILGGDYRGLRDLLWKRFAEAYGTPNNIRLLSSNMEDHSLTFQLMHGITKPIGYDLSRAGLVLSFGCDWLETWKSPVFQFRAYGRLRGGAEGTKAKIFHVDSRYSITAAKSDQWIPINPGKEAVLALGLAHIIIRESLYDGDFVGKYCFGFEDWRDISGKRRLGFRSTVLKSYEPMVVSRITGVPLKTLFGLARELAGTKPALVLGAENKGSFGKGDIYTRMAIHSLNALTGNIGKAGVFTVQGGVPFSPLEPLAGDPAVRKALSLPRIDGAGEGQYFLAENTPLNLPNNIIRQKPYPLNMLILNRANPVYHAPDGEAFVQALKKVPHLISFSSFMDESTQYADLVLPEQHYLERWQDDIVTHLSGFSLFSLGRPAVAPVANARNSIEVLFDIARKMGDGISSAFPWNKYEDLLNRTAGGLYAAGRGNLVSTPHEEAFRKVLERQGYRIPEYKSYADFWEGLQAAGAWWDPSDSYAGSRYLLGAPTKTFDFYSRKLKERFEKEAVRAAEDASISPDEAIKSLSKMMGIEAEGDLLFLPHDESDENNDDEYPFYLNTYKLNSLGDGSGANQPWLQESMVIHVHASWDAWAEINPHTAKKLGIEENDPILLESPWGAIKVRAKLFEGTMPEVVNVPMGQGHTAYGRWADDRGENPNRILTRALDPFTGLPLTNKTRVKISKV